MIYAISDLHGYPLEKFQNLLKKAEFNDEDYLFVLGDVIDLGMDGIKYLKWLMLQPNVELILGNHEAMMLSCDFLFDEVSDESASRLSATKLKLLETWKDNGARWTLEGLYILRPAERKHVIEFLRDAPLYDSVDIGDKRFILTHSGLGNYSNDKRFPSLTDEYRFGTITVFGHTPTFVYGNEYNGKVLKTETWINIDVGAGYGYSPVLLRLDDMKEIYAE